MMITKYCSQNYGNTILLCLTKEGGCEIYETQFFFSYSYFWQAYVFDGFPRVCLELLNLGQM